MVEFDDLPSADNDFPGLQPGDAQRDAIRVAEEVLGHRTLDREQLTDEQVAGRTDLIRLRALRNRLTRDQAVDLGAQLGEMEADKRGETGREKEQRVARAKAYAAWEYDGKPANSNHMAEFNVTQRSDNVVGTSGPDWKKGGKK